MKVLVFLSCGLVLNQDLQDFEDYLVLGVVWDGARSSMKFKKISAFFQRRCDDRSD
jgi:sRNA-binding regulator protein Hfq